MSKGPLVLQHEGLVLDALHRDLSIGLVPPPPDFSQLAKPCALTGAAHHSLLAAWPPLIQTLRLHPGTSFQKYTLAPACV